MSNNGLYPPVDGASDGFYANSSNGSEPAPVNPYAQTSPAPPTQSPAQEVPVTQLTSPQSVPAQQPPSAVVGGTPTYMNIMSPDPQDIPQQYGLFPRKQIGLRVSVTRGRGLRPVTSKPHKSFVNLQLGSRPDHSFSTNAVSDLANPEWSTNTFEFLLPLQEFYADPILHIYVFNNKMGLSNDEFQGRTCVDCRQLLQLPSRSAAQWCRLEESERRTGSGAPGSWGELYVTLSLSQPTQTNHTLTIDGGAVLDCYGRIVFQMAVLPQPLKTRVFYGTPSVAQAMTEVCKCVNVGQNKSVVVTPDGKPWATVEQSGTFVITQQPVGKNYKLLYEGSIKLVAEGGQGSELVATLERIPCLSTNEKFSLKIKPTEDVAMIMALLCATYDLLPRWKTIAKLF